MFIRKDLISHSGIMLDWKIECDDLTVEDLDTLAYVVAKRINFGSVLGIPSGGLKFAAALTPYITRGPRLLVNDVLTIDSSMAEYKVLGDIGIVIFAREQCPYWVQAIFQLMI